RALAGTDETDEQLLEKAIAFEGHADNVAPCLLGGVTVSTAKSTIRLETPGSIRVLVCVAPNAMRTDSARAALPKDVARADAVANVGRAALLVAAITQGRSEVLMEATKDDLHQRARFDLMPESGELVLSLRGSEVPAFLSGAGPSVAALVDEISADHAEKAARTLAPQGWEVRVESIDPQGARIVSRREK
ncbi:MAG TPA: homoserine kinase, partial [Actinomycetota bacterium]|nr:homoserine kinase [Actinomycetota bacterium]